MRLDRRVEPVDLDSLLDDLVPADDQSVIGEDLVVRRDVPLLLNGRQVDLVDLGRFAAAARTNQADVLRLGGGQQAARVLKGIQDRLVAGPRQLASDQDIAKNIIVLRVIGRDVDEDPIGFSGRDDYPFESSTSPAFGGS